MRKNGSDLTRRRRNDLWLILIILLAAAAAFLFLTLQKKTGSTVEVRVDGAVYGTYPLAEDASVPIEGDGWENLLVIEDGEASVTEADCPDKICVEHAPISSVGETIVCLPHKVVVEVVSDGNTEEGLDAIAE